MSVQAISWVIENSKHSGNPFVVLLMIANHAKSDGTGAWPSVKCIAKESRVSEETTHRAIRKLAKSGELRVEVSAGPHGTNLYSLPKVGGCQIGGVSPVTPEPSLHIRTNIFTEPSKEQVLSYMKEIGIKNSEEQSEAFVDHHTARGWILSGRQKMKNWRAAVRTWKRNMKLYDPKTKADVARAELLDDSGAEALPF